MKEYTTNSKTSGVLGQRHLKGTLKGDATLCLKGLKGDATLYFTDLMANLPPGEPAELVRQIFESGPSLETAHPYSDRTPTGTSNM